MKNIVIIVNQQSGKESKNSLIHEIQTFFEKKAGTDSITILSPESPDEARQFAKEACENKVDLIIPLGGDGTINLVCAGIFEGGGHSRLGIIPSGTVNNLAKSLNIPLDLSSALNNLLQGQEKAFDIAQVNDDYMVSSLTLGLMADMALGVTPEDKRKLGPLAFIKAGWKIWIRQRSYKLILQYNGQRRKIKTKLLLITMSNTIAGQQGFTPHEDTDDGLFSVYSLKKLHFLRFLWFFFIRKGNFNQYRHWEHFRTGELRIINRRKSRAKNPVVRIDGDTGSRLPVTITIHPHAITTIVPK